MMEMYVSLGATSHWGQWRFVSIMSGAQCVMTTGILMMPEWFADSLDYQHHVRMYPIEYIYVILYWSAENFVYSPGLGLREFTHRSNGRNY